jgi:hypothetical protein
LATTGERRSATIAVDSGWAHDGGLDCSRSVCAGIDDNLIDVLVEGFLRETDEFVYTIQVIKDFVAVFAELVC